MYIYLQSQGTHSHILLTGEGGVVRENFLGLKFWPKGIFFESVKDAGIFCGSPKKTWNFFGVLHFSSAQVKNNILIFLSKQILKLRYF